MNNTMRFVVSSIVIGFLITFLARPIEREVTNEIMELFGS